MGRKIKNGFAARKTLPKEKIKRRQNTPKVFVEQNRLREILERIRPRALKPVNEVGTGVDFTFVGIKIDQKFSFGALGNNNIKIRVKNKELLNQSDWTLCINNSGKAILFPTRRLANFVLRENEIIKKNLLIDKGSFSEHSVSLEHFFESEAVKPITCDLTAKSLLKALREMNEKQTGKKAQKQKWFSMFLGPNRQLKLMPKSQIELAKLDYLRKRN